VDELLDFLARDGKTSAILLYLEHLSVAGGFVSAGGWGLVHNTLLVIKTRPRPYNIKKISFRTSPVIF
ncbi:hypothetical protein ACVGWV_09285, partial [Enterobacter asburiae]